MEVVVGRRKIGTNEAFVFGEIEVAIEQRMRIAALSASGLQKMQQRILTRLGDIGIAREIPTRVEHRVRIAAARCAFPEVMFDRGEIGAGDVRVALPIVGDIEIAVGIAGGIT